jgi:hypothetical protein
MGCFKLSGGSNTDYGRMNPNPYNFRISWVKQYGNYFVSKVNYPDATNFEGMKILLTTFDPRGRPVLDPHFAENSGILARFEPSEYGIYCAGVLAQTLNGPSV